jgi:hypothetical protein
MAITKHHIKAGAKSVARMYVLIVVAGTIIIGGIGLAIMGPECSLNYIKEHYRATRDYALSFFKDSEKGIIEAASPLESYAQEAPLEHTGTNTNLESNATNIIAEAKYE